MISIIIPTLNEEIFLPQLLTSLTGQTEKDFEVIVVDGSSKDKTVDVAKSFAGTLSSLEVVRSTTASLPLQRNLGAQHAKGEWLAFVDADGVFLPYFIQRCSQFVRQRPIDFFTTWFCPDSEVQGDAILTLVMNLTLETSKMLKFPFGPGPLTVVRRSAFEAVGGYDQNRTYNEDLDLSLRLNKAKYQFGILRETLCVWSLRRFRKEGTLKIVQSYAIAAVYGFVTRRPLKNMPGYLMGGHLYSKNKKKSFINRSVIKQYKKKLKQVMKEFFE